MLSLAAGTALDAAPGELIDAAAVAGFDACGLRLDPAAVSDHDADAIRRRLDERGIALLDLEVARLRAGEPARVHRPLLELAGTLGASWVLTVLEIPDRAEQLDVLAEFDALAGEAGVAVSLEFMAFTAVRTLEAALDLAREVPRCRVLVDALHLARTGGTAAAVGAAAPRISYVQLCDGPAAAPGAGTPGELADEARHRRRLPGAGEFDLAALVRSVPGHTPFSVEVQSDELAARLSVTERARQAAAAAAAVLAAGQSRPAGSARGT